MTVNKTTDQILKEWEREEKKLQKKKEEETFKLLKSLPSIPTGKVSQFSAQKERERKAQEAEKAKKEEKSKMWLTYHTSQLRETLRNDPKLAAEYRADIKRLAAKKGGRKTRKFFKKKTMKRRKGIKSLKKKTYKRK